MFTLTITPLASGWPVEGSINGIATDRYEPNFSIPTNRARTPSQRRKARKANVKSHLILRPVSSFLSVESVMSPRSMPRLNCKGLLKDAYAADWPQQGNAGRG